jgi:short-subunit dehydrogenase
MSRLLAIVTGASSEIGLALARELAVRKYDLAICSSGERLENAAESLRSTGSEVLAVRANLAHREGVKHFWDEVRSLGPDIDIACINAGVGVGGLFSETELERRTEYGRLELCRDSSARELRCPTYNFPERGTNTFYGFDCRRDGGAPRSCLCGDQSV